MARWRIAAHLSALRPATLRSKNWKEAGKREGGEASWVGEGGQTGGAGRRGVRRDIYRGEEVQGEVQERVKSRARRGEDRMPGEVVYV